MGSKLLFGSSDNNDPRCDVQLAMGEITWNMKNSQ